MSDTRKKFERDPYEIQLGEFRVIRLGDHRPEHPTIAVYAIMARCSCGGYHSLATMETDAPMSLVVTIGRRKLLDEEQGLSAIDGILYCPDCLPSPDIVTQAYQALYGDDYEPGE